MSWKNYRGGDCCPECDGGDAYLVGRGAGVSLIWRCADCGEEYAMEPEREYERGLAVERQIERELEEARS